MSPETGACRSCGEERPLRELLRVTTIRTGAVYFVCRPGLRTEQMCFRKAVPTADIASIALAVPR